MVKRLTPLLLGVWFQVHTMDLLWEKFQWILLLYMKPISFQSKASVVCSVITAIFIDFLPEETKCVFPMYWSKIKWISEFRRTNPQELKYWSTFCVNYFLRYYLMVQHQPTVKRVNGTHEWAHRPYQLLSAHCRRDSWQIYLLTLPVSHPRYFVRLHNETSHVVLTQPPDMKGLVRSLIS